LVAAEAVVGNLAGKTVPPTTHSPDQLALIGAALSHTNCQEFGDERRNIVAY
jgi:hypothetical protein